MRGRSSGLGLLTLCMFLIACGKTQSVTQESAHLPDDHVVNLYFWADNLAPDTLSTFEKQTGIKVKVTYFDTVAVNETRLFTGHNGFDVVLNSPPSFRRLIESGAFQKLDKSRLPNLGNLDPTLMAKLSRDDPENAYGVIFDWGTYGIVTNDGKVSETLPGVPLDSWGVLFNPINASKLAGCNVHFVDTPVAVIPLILQYLARDVNNPTARDLEDVGKVLHTIRPYVHSIDSVGQIETLANGDVCAALDSNGDAYQAHERAREAKNGIKIDYGIPREGSLIWFDLLAIPRDAPHVANAHKLINYLLEPQVIANMTSAIGLANANRKATPLIDPTISANRLVYPSADQIRQLLPIPEYTPEQIRAVTRLWQKFKTGQ